jgi:predicted MPP superfamily phosphohydrolase
MSFTYNWHALPWDLAILLLMFGGAFGAYLAFQQWKQKQKMFFCVLGCFGVLLALVVFYGSFIEPRIITVTEHQVSLPVEEEMKIVVLGDFHVGPYKGRNFVERVVKKVNELRPDLILLAGDYIYYGDDPGIHLEPLKDLEARYGVIGILGNHEYSCYGGNSFIARRVVGFDQSARVLRLLERLGVTMLRNSATEIALDSGPLHIAGIDDMCTGRDRLEEALPEIQRKAPVILLSHDPSVILDNNAKYPNLIISAHTHAGQIRLPLIGALTNLPTQLGRKYDQGLFEIDKNTTLAITRGVGESGPRARLFAWPEIMVLHVDMLP